MSNVVALFPDQTDRPADDAPCPCWLCGIRAVEAQLRTLSDSALLVDSDDLAHLAHNLHGLIHRASDYVNTMEPETQT